MWPFRNTACQARDAVMRQVLANTQAIIATQGENVQAIQGIKTATDTLVADVAALNASLAAEKTKVDQLIAIATNAAANGGLAQVDLDTLASIKAAVQGASASLETANTGVQGESAAADAALNPPPAPSAGTPPAPAAGASGDAPQS